MVLCLFGVAFLHFSEGPIHWAFIRSISKSDRTFYLRVLEVSNKMLVEYQSENSHLPEVQSDHEFARD